MATSPISANDDYDSKIRLIKRSLPNLNEIRKSQDRLDRELESLPGTIRETFLGKDLGWAGIYEYSFEQHITFVVFALNKVELFKHAFKQPDPNQVILDEFDNESDGDEWNGGWESKFSKQDLIGLVTSLRKTILCVMIYQRTMSTMIEEVRLGSDEALFHAVRIDRSAVNCPTIAARIAKAELTNDKYFFIHLISALKGLSKRHWRSYEDLRYALFVLCEMGLNNLTDEELENLLVKQLKLYPDTPNARKNLRKQYNAAKKINHLK
ncbi:hypothetical protein [Methylobacillus flagellatus]|uniref:hypothetical protein n=1 Tax=Methylobacillus flagellatus TaxID=405 RepID=UPI0010F58662|nr:hypothetical protein [Methylobacillus flagellatus]